MFRDYFLVTPKILVNSQTVWSEDPEGYWRSTVVRQCMHYIISWIKNVCLFCYDMCFYPTFASQVLIQQNKFSRLANQGSVMSSQAVLYTGPLWNALLYFFKSVMTCNLPWRNQSLLGPIEQHRTMVDPVKSHFHMVLLNIKSKELYTILKEDTCWYFEYMFV